mmetsp:Transcript_23777/g.62173  ORF Transcript_23777/g.62173 Transcript_23777/m.62173 type:complete len:231 (-) Transcript_23777:83-775(-)
MPKRGVCPRRDQLATAEPRLKRDGVELITRPPAPSKETSLVRSKLPRLARLIGTACVTAGFGSFALQYSPFSQPKALCGQSRSVPAIPTDRAAGGFGHPLSRPFAWRVVLAPRGRPILLHPNSHVAAHPTPCVFSKLPRYTPLLFHCVLQWHPAAQRGALFGRFHLGAFRRQLWSRPRTRPHHLIVGLPAAVGDCPACGGFCEPRAPPPHYPSRASTERGRRVFRQRVGR